MSSNVLNDHAIVARTANLSLTVTPTETQETSITIKCGQPLLVSSSGFPKLPLELRLIIWKLSLPPGRTIYFNEVGVPKTNDLPASTTLKADWILPTPLLHVNQESREFALQVYELYAGPWSGNPIYINFSKDTLCFGGLDQLYLAFGYEYISLLEHCMQEKSAHFIEKIYHIRFRSPFFALPWILRAMPALRTVAITIDLTQLDIWIGIGGYFGDFLSSREDLKARARVVERLTGVNEGLWTGPKDKLPILLP
ncbi:hypothetical protein VTL71DRAFT_10306 [Oculimacula yallundae]|uniref:2EXR domain-containing protein n=1 Tax=Oculimacula yallundae TaxID=86028 RepID=A0ABR4CT63_9HELO